MRRFREKDLKELYKPGKTTSKEDNGQIVIIGGSSLFHGAPILALKTAARICDMVFFVSPEKTLKAVVAKIKSSLASFIWIPWKEVEEYIAKADACLIGPGLLRYRSERQKKGCEKKGMCGLEAVKTQRITESLFKKFPQKKWVIDAASLQVIRPEVLPKKALITPNKKEYKMLFGDESPETSAKKYDLIIVYKTPETLICSAKKSIIINGGNAGLTKGGTGDVLAGLTVALLSKNDPFLAASAASFVVKKAADVLYERVGFAYSADDLAEEIPQILGKYYRL